MSDHMPPRGKRHDIALPPVRRGSTVQACPGTPLWQSGARFGHVVATRRLEALVALGRGRRLWVSLNSILEAYEYLTCCADLSTFDVPDLEAMTEAGREIGYRTARRDVGRDALASTFPCYDWRQRPFNLTMKQDWHVRYHRSIFRGRPCICVVYSAIDYIFVEGLNDDAR